MTQDFDNSQVETGAPAPPAPCPSPETAPETSSPPVSPITEPAAQAPAEAAVPGKRKSADTQGGWMASLQSLAVTVVIAVFVITFIVQAFQIPSESMEDTLLIGDYLLVDKVHYASGGIWGHVLPYSNLQRGDIVVFRYPVHPSQHFVKRVIGLPGDRIHLVNRRVYVNDQPLDEPYVVFKLPPGDIYRDDFPALDYLSGNVEARWWLQMRKLVKNGDLVVPPGEYFVMGDNRDESLDSRYWGFVPRENVVGRPLLIYWSIEGLEDRLPLPQSPQDKLARFGYVLTHICQQTRWHRTMRLVH